MDFGRLGGDVGWGQVDGEKWVEMVVEMAQMIELKGILSSGAD